MSSKHKEHRKARRRPGRNRRRLRATLVAMAAVVAVAAVGAFTFGNRNSGASADVIAEATGTLRAPQVFHDFGRISMGNGLVRHRFPVRNGGDTPAVVRKVYTSCMCTEASLLVDGQRYGPFGMQGHGYIPQIDRVIAPGESAVVEAVFDPNAHGPAGIGRNDRGVSVLLGGRRMLQLQFTAYVTP